MTDLDGVMDDEHSWKFWCSVWLFVLSFAICSYFITECLLYLVYVSISAWWPWSSTRWNWIIFWLFQSNLTS